MIELFKMNGKTVIFEVCYSCDINILINLFVF